MKFSILLPTKNRLDLLKGALYTVLSQEYKDLEIIVADNCSEQNIKSYMDELADDRIIYIRSEVPLSVTDNWNKALDKSSGDYVLMLGDDDGLTPGYLERLREIIKTYKNPDFIYQGAYIYGFPGAIAWRPEGFMFNTTEHIPLFKGKEMHQSLTVQEALHAAQESTKLKLVFPFNMQHFVYRRSFIKKMMHFGEFFQGPFPDFYAGILSMILGKKMILWNSPQVIIGISKKSFGYFFFNEIEEEGIDFLDIQGYEENLPHSIAKCWLPISHMENAWLVSALRVLAKFPARTDLKLDMKHYQIKQLSHLVSRRLTLKNLVFFLSLFARAIDKKKFIRFFMGYLRHNMKKRPDRNRHFLSIKNLSHGWKSVKEVFDGLKS